MTADESDRVGSTSEPAFVVPGPLPNDVAIWLIRHGETEWSRSGQHTGRTDLTMTPAGERQAIALRGMVDGLRPALVLSSPRIRSRRTAELTGLSVDGIDDDLAEWDYGDYEGLTTAQIRSRVPGWTIWSDPVPGGETPAQVGARADRVLRRALSRISDGPVVLFAHGHVSRVIAARWIGLAPADGARFALGTAAPSLLGAEHGAPVITRWNIPNPAAD